jgi:hypothetical protein
MQAGKGIEQIRGIDADEAFPSLRQLEKDNRRVAILFECEVLPEGFALRDCSRR